MAITITPDRGVPAFHVAGDGRVNFIRLNGGIHSMLRDAEATFSMVPTLDEATTNKAVVEGIFESAGIAMKETNAGSVVLENPADLGRAMEALGWSKEVRTEILQASADIAIIIAQSRRSPLGGQTR